MQDEHDSYGSDPCAPLMPSRGDVKWTTTAGISRFRGHGSSCCVPRGSPGLLLPDQDRVAWGDWGEDQGKESTSSKMGGASSMSESEDADMDGREASEPKPPLPKSPPESGLLSAGPYNRSWGPMDFKSADAQGND